MPCSRMTWTLAAVLSLIGGTLVPLPVHSQQHSFERAAERLLEEGQTQLEADRPDAAVKFFTKALEITRDRATENELHFFAAYAHFQRGRAMEDENSREKCARTRRSLDAYEAARTHLDEAGDVRPDAQDRIRQALGTLLYRQRQIIGKACSGGDRDEGVVDPSVARRPGRVTPPPQRRPPLEAERRERGARGADEDAGRLPVEFEAVLIEPSSPTEGQRVSVGVAAKTKPPHEIERIVVRIGGSEYYSRFGEHRFDRKLGPFERGSHVLEILAEGPEGRTSHTVRRELRVRSAGGSVIEGRITGERELVTEVQLLDDDRRVLQRVTPNRGGRYRFAGLDAGSYWIHVAAGGKRGDVRVEGGPSVHLRVDGGSSYERDFRVTCREGCR